MAAVEALLVLSIVVALIWGVTALVRSRTTLRRERETRAHQVAILSAAKEVTQLLLLDDEVAERVYAELGEKLRR